MIYKVGMRVKINDEGHARYGECEMNPRRVHGTIVSFTREGDFANVVFDNGVENNYEDGFLTIIE